MRAQNTRWIVALAAGLAFAGAALADGGRVTVAEDSTLVRPGRQNVPLERGMVVQAGDTIATGEAGSAQWWMEDDSVVTAARGTTFKIHEFVTPQKSGGAGRAVFELVRGAFRTVSGLIGRGASDTYQVRTSVATMGIRGTTYTAAMCDNNCFDGKGNKLPNGLYVAVFQGTVRVTNGAGSLDVPAGKIAFVASANSRAEFVAEGPVVFVELQNEIQFEFEIDPDLDRIEPPVSPS